MGGEQALPGSLGLSLSAEHREACIRGASSVHRSPFRDDRGKFPKKWDLGQDGFKKLACLAEAGVNHSKNQQSRKVALIAADVNITLY